MPSASLEPVASKSIARWAMPEVVDAVRYLASDAASYTNGVILPVNGGSYLS